MNEKGHKYFFGQWPEMPYKRKEKEMKVYKNDAEYYVAESLEDLLILWKEHIGDDYIEDGYGTLDDWEELPPDTEITIWWNYEDEINSIPKDVIPIEKYGSWLIKATASQWAKSNGRGFLCSTEY